MSTDEREPLGRLVHETRIAFEAERSALKDRPGFILAPWEERHPEQQELDMRIGAEVAAAERERILRRAFACRDCGQEHPRRPVPVDGVRPAAFPYTRDAPDGHHYRPRWYPDNWRGPLESLTGTGEEPSP